MGDSVLKLIIIVLDKVKNMTQLKIFQFGKQQVNHSQQKYAVSPPIDTYIMHFSQ